MGRTLRIHHHTTKGVRAVNEDEYSVKHGDRGLMCAVYDGHGGGEVSVYLKKYLSNMVYNNMDGSCPNSKKLLKTQFSKTVINLDKYLSKRGIDAGSTALVACIKDSTVCIANTGDCRAVLCSNGLAIPLTKDHKPGFTEEKIRLLALGGDVVYDKNIKGFRVAGMSVSRSFGDLDRQPYIIATPDVYRHRIKKTDKCIILATDGLWDVLSNQDAVEHVLGCTATKNVAASLCRKAVELRSSDNVTAIVIFL